LSLINPINLNKIEEENMAYLLRILFVVILTTGFIFSQTNSSRSKTTNKLNTPINIQSDASVLFVDDMNGDNSVAGLEARGWVVLNVDGGGTTPPFNQGDILVFNSYEGPADGYTYSNYNGANGFLIDHWLISPEITVSSGDTLRFWHRSPDGNTWDDSIYVRYSTTAGITPGSFDQTWGRYLVSETGWAQWVGTFSHTGTIRFAIQYYITDGGPSGNHSNYMGLDLIEVAGVGGSSGNGLPELLYYIFDENTGTTTANYAVPGVGNNPASLTGATTWAIPGQFGSAISGDGTASGGIVTGWNCDLGAGSWTIGMWLEIPTNATGSALYLFGDGGSTSFRCFHNGVALPDNLVLRGGGLTDVYVNGIGPAPTVVHFVYDAAVPEVRAYKDGVLYSTSPQAALNMPTGTGFKVAGYGTSLIMSGKMDEFRLYNRALDATEIAATWNISIVPVELTSFTALVNGDDVQLLWITASELNNSGFSIERKYSNNEFIEVGFVPGFGTTTEPKSYSFNDDNLRSGVYTYRLKQIDFDGTFTYSDEVEVDIAVPATFSLDQNYPNPFNPNTRISFSLAVDSKVSLKIFDVLGQEVASPVNQDNAGNSHV
jgi:Concanavalin A-like lectin/glucanases superfamily